MIFQCTIFQIWISESPDHFKPELAQLLYPMFTHLYLELVCSGQKVMAQKFHKRHHVTFQANAEFSSFIRQLSATNSPETVFSDPAVSAYRTSKYRVTLSTRTFHYLRRYLQTCGGQPVLLHVLTQKVDLKLADALGACSSAEAVKRIEKVIHQWLANGCVMFTLLKLMYDGRAALCLQNKPFPGQGNV
jgi:hypothetical protein